MQSTWQENTTAKKRSRKILSSSVRLFIEKGYHETTMTEILHDAGVSGQFSLHFFTQKMAFLQNLQNSCLKISLV